MDCFLAIEGDRATLKIVGVITVDNAFHFQEKLNEVKKSGVRHFDLDFSECQTISSVGIGKILMYYKEFQSKTHEIKIVRCSQPVYELFMTIKLNQLISISL